MKLLKVTANFKTHYYESAEDYKKQIVSHYNRFYNRISYTPFEVFKLKVTGLHSYDWQCIFYQASNRTEPNYTKEQLKIV